MYASTSLRVADATSGRPLSTRDTVAMDTPVSRAMSLIASPDADDFLGT